MTTDMTKGEIVPMLLKFAGPLLLGNLFQQFYNTFDTFIVGRFLGSEALAAIGATSHLVFTIINFSNGLSTGAQVVISQFFGARKYDSLKRAIGTTVFAGLAFSVFATFIQLLLSPYILRLISTPPQVLEQANAYLGIYFLGTVALILYNLGSAILRALGDSFRALVFLIISSVTNILLDIVFVIFLHKGIEGAALATVISEIFSALLVLHSLCSLKSQIRLELHHPKIDLIILRKILKIGLPGAISSGIIALSNTVMQRYVNFFGATCMAGWAIFSKFDQIAILPMQSLSYGATTFVAQNYGAKKLERIREGVKKSFIVNFVIMAVTSAAIVFPAYFYASLFSDDSEVIFYAVQFIRLTAPFYILCGFTMLYSQILRGFGRSLAPTIITIGGFVVFRQILLFIISRTINTFTLIALVYPAAWPVIILIYLLYLNSKRKSLPREL